MSLFGHFCLLKDIERKKAGRGRLSTRLEWGKKCDFFWWEGEREGKKDGGRESLKRTDREWERGKKEGGREGEWGKEREGGIEKGRLMNWAMNGEGENLSHCFIFNKNMYVCALDCFFYFNFQNQSLKSLLFFFRNWIFFVMWDKVNLNVSFTRWIFV